MIRAGRAAGAALAWMLLLFTLAAVVWGIAGNGDLLGREMLRFAPPERSGLPEAEYAGVGRMTAGYLTGREEDFQYVYSDGSGNSRVCFQRHEADHMRDCRGLIGLAGTLRWVFGGLALALLGAGVLCPGMRRPMARGALAGLALFGGLAAALLAWGLVDFDGLFVTFHRIAFTNEGWLLDPSKDLLIRLMPVEFFIALAVRCLLWLAGTAAVTGIVSYELCRIVPPAGGGTEKPGNRPDPGAGNQL